ncbi:MAG TPA: flippase [Terriglobales bacterium]|nr:flippase [Terriglobales bacterium]
MNPTNNILSSPPLPAAPKRSVILNSLWNFAGQISPLLLAAFAIPVLIHGLGVNRFGVLTLVWILVGYFSFFDLGMGRAITKLLAEKIALNDLGSAASLIWTAAFSMMLLGILFGGLLFVFAPYLINSVLKIPPELRQETLHCIPWLAASVPFVTLTSGLRGTLEAQQNFAVVNALRAGLGFITYLAPLAVLLFSHNLFPIVVTLALARMLGCVLHFWACRRYVPTFTYRVKWERRSLRALLGFGSWITISNLSSPLMVYFDRFLIASVLSISVVAYYTAPFDAVTKLWLIPAALAGVLFPAFSEALAVENRERAISLYERSIASTLALLFPVILGIVLFAHEGLLLWLGPNFANRSTVLLQILAIGVFTNSLANMPYALLQAWGRPDITAKLHLVEIPCYFALLYWGIRTHGIEGAALAWTIRLSVEAAVLFFVLRGVLAPRLWITMAAGTAALVLAVGVREPLFEICYFIPSVAIFAWVIWRWTMDDLLRLRVLSLLKTMPVLNRANA